MSKGRLKASALQDVLGDEAADLESEPQTTVPPLSVAPPDAPAAPVGRVKKSRLQFALDDEEGDGSSVSVRSLTGCESPAPASAPAGADAALGGAGGGSGLLKSVRRPGAPVKYRVLVYTGDVKGAGTDARVFVSIVGSLATVLKKRLKYSTSGISTHALFEQGQMDEFIIECPELGELTRLVIEHDNSGLGPGWFLDKVVVRVRGQGLEARQWTFPCGRWLATDEDDKQTRRTLEPSPEKQVLPSPLEEFAEAHGARAFDPVAAAKSWARGMVDGSLAMEAAGTVMGAFRALHEGADNMIYGPDPRRKFEAAIAERPVLPRRAPQLADALASRVGLVQYEKKDDDAKETRDNVDRIVGAVEKVKSFAKRPLRPYTGGYDPVQAEALMTRCELADEWAVTVRQRGARPAPPPEEKKAEEKGAGPEEKKKEGGQEGEEDDLELSEDEGRISRALSFLKPPKEVPVKRKTIGHLRVELLGAEQLEGGELTRTDPFCVVTLEGAEHPTGTCPGTADPTWNETFHLPVTEPTGFLLIEVYDRNRLTADSFLGCIRVPLWDLADQQEHERQYEIGSKKRWRVGGTRTGAIRGFRFRGKLHVKLQYTVFPAPYYFSHLGNPPLEDPNDPRRVYYNQTQVLFGSMKDSFESLKPCLTALLPYAKMVEKVKSWDNPLYSLACFCLYLAMVKYLHLLPTFFLLRHALVVLLRGFNAKPGKHADLRLSKAVTFGDDAERDEVNVEGNTGSEQENAYALYTKLRGNILALQNAMYGAVRFLERLDKLVRWDVRWMTALYVALLALLAAVLYAVPLRAILVLVGVHQITSRWRTPDNPLVNFVSRLPDEGPKIAWNKYEEIEIPPPEVEKPAGAAAAAHAGAAAAGGPGSGIGRT
eukprot:tig00001127_g7158.t1